MTTEPSNWFHQRSKTVTCPVCKARDGERCHEEGKEILGSHAGRFKARSAQDRLMKQARIAFQDVSVFTGSCGPLN